MKESKIQIDKVAEHVWCFEDEHHDSFYLVEGSEKAIVIDTGMSKEPILPILRQITDKPLVLLLTHAHIDHIYHCDEFDTVYLHEDDSKAWKGVLGLSMWFAAKFMFHVKAKRYPVASFHAVVEGDKISLGDYSLQIARCAGHTPGSIVVIDDANQLVFSGDAFGSGSGIFLWTPGSLCISRYQKELERLLITLHGKESYLFLGGHRSQGKPYSEKEDTHPLDIQVVLDTVSLCQKIAKNTLEPLKKVRFFFLQIYWYSYQHAGIAVRKNRIK